MNKILISALQNIDFLEKFKALSEKYNASPEDDYSIDVYQDTIESFGYACVYNKKHKFFKVDNFSNLHGLYINISITRKK